MSSGKRIANLEKDLNLRETEFLNRLTSALRECAAGSWGLFGANEASLDAHFGASGGGRYRSVARNELIELAEEIEALRLRLGYTDASHWVQRFRDCSADSTAPNAMGEPKLAQALLDEIQLVQ